jgi:hypothetical protein
MPATKTFLATGACALLIAVAGCGGSSSKSANKSTTPAGNGVNPNGPEVSPTGDIPDNQAYVPVTPPGGGFSVKVPEGWSRTSVAGTVTFTDKLNSVRMQSFKVTGNISVDKLKTAVDRQLQRSGKSKAQVSVVQRKAGPVLRIASTSTGKPDAVTGKARPLAVERYMFFHNGKEVILTLSAPKGADNVDPWRIVTDSLRWTQ